MQVAFSGRLQASAAMMSYASGTRSIPPLLRACVTACLSLLQRDAQALRDTGYFDEVRLRVEDDPSEPNGKIVAFDVKEKPVVRRIEYRGIKSISMADIQNAYKDNKITLSVESWFDPEKLMRAATVIEELLAAHGHPSAVVKPTYERTASANVVIILLTIDEGPKVQPSPNPR